VLPTTKIAKSGTELERNQGMRGLQAPGVIAGGPTVKIHEKSRMSGRRSREAKATAKAFLSPYCIDRPSTICSAP
jgi:hypothetical protein